MSLTQRQHHERRRGEVVQLALRSDRGQLLVYERGADADVYPGFLCLPQVPDTVALHLRQGASRFLAHPEAIPRALQDAIRLLCQTFPGDSLSSRSVRAWTVTYPRLTRRRVTATVLEVFLGDQPEPRTGAWVSPTTIATQWQAGRVLLDPVLLEYLGRCTRATSSPTSAAVPATKAGTDPLLALDPPQLPGNVTWRVRPNVVLAALKSLTIPPASRTNTFLLTGQPALIIDPGSRFAAQRNELVRLIDVLYPREAPLSVVLTHHHDDHLGAVAWLRRRRRVQVMAHAETARLVSGNVHVDRLVRDGDQISAGGRRLTVIHTPGHAPGHVCLFDPSDGSLFAGDMVAGIGTVVIDPRDGSLSEYLESLQRLAALRPSVLLPAHGPPIGAPLARLDAYVAHRQERSEEILQVLEAGPRTAGAIAKQVYRGLPIAIQKVGIRTVLSHLADLQARGLVVSKGRRFMRTSAPGS